ncbi:BTB/POZ domain-containing protein 6-like [Paramacrobiotus metropolitanus]|uniref:BTB/POZ domain-containing protein 6-like n=1 Tax=Paramacrobiotus metropolitanus TaxID=2943436 RepID=UPI0024457BF8|nr:BTB/POZ domain-containing protein 6-like [Paramacrobiotus metropolitanus]
MASQNRAATTPHERRDPGAGLLSCTKETLVSGDLSDVQFSVGNDFGAAKAFKGHKYIVSIRSTVFYRMFYGSVPENGPQVDIPDCMPDAFENMLSYMYTDAVDKENLTMENVFPTMRFTLEQAIHWHADHIVEACLQLVELNSDIILSSDSFSTITHDILKMILQRCVLSAEENVIYMAVERTAPSSPTCPCPRNGAAVEPRLPTNRRHLRKTCSPTARLAARIIGRRPTTVVVRWCATGEQGSVAAEKVVRAADILKSGQPVFCQMEPVRRAGMYLRVQSGRVGDQHLVRFAAGDQA